MNKISYIICLAMLFIAQTLCAQEKDNSILKPRLVTIEYQTVDECNRPLTMSANITLPALGQKASKVILANTSRNRISQLSMSKGDNMTSLWTFAADNNAAVVEPENVVNGDSKLTSIPQYSYDLAGRQSIDALYAAINYLKETGKISDEEYKSYIIGYGLGARVALAAQRSLERDYTEEQKAVVRMSSIFYGNAESNPSKEWSEALAGSNAYSAYNTIIMLDNMLKTYSEGCMKSFTDKDVFSEKLLNSHIIDFINSNNYSVIKIKNLLYKTFGSQNPSIDQLVSGDLKIENSAVRRAMEKALAKSNLTNSWNPEYPDFCIAGSSLPFVEKGNMGMLIETLKESIISAEDMFVSTVYYKIFDKESLTVPILLYYDSSILAGTLFINGNLNVTLNVTMYSLFMEKTADVSLTVSPDVLSSIAGKLPGKVNIGYYGRGWIGMDIDANNVIPFVQNISGLIGDGSFQSKEQADSVALLLNGACNNFNIAINEVKNWFNGSFNAAEGSEAGTYKIDLLFNREDKSISLATIKKLLF